MGQSRAENLREVVSRPELVIQVRKTPHGVAASHDGTRVYVTHFLSGSVSVIDTATHSETTAFDVNPGLYGVAVKPDGERIYVADNSSGFVYLIDSASGLNIGAGIGRRPYGLAMSSDGSRLYAACALDDSIEVLDRLVKNRARLKGVDFPVGLAVSPANGDRIYATNYFSSSVSVIDTTSIKLGDFNSDAVVVAKIAVSEGPYGIAVSPDGTRVYVAHFESSGLISVIDTLSLGVIGTMTAKGGWGRGAAVHPDGSRLYITNYLSSSVSVMKL